MRPHVVDVFFFWGPFLFPTIVSKGVEGSSHIDYITILRGQILEAAVGGFAVVSSRERRATARR